MNMPVPPSIKLQESTAVSINSSEKSVGIVNSKTLGALSSILSCSVPVKDVPVQSFKKMTESDVKNWITSKINAALISLGVPEEKHGEFEDAVFASALAGKLGNGTPSDETAQAIANMVTELAGTAAAETPAVIASDEPEAGIKVGQEVGLAEPIEVQVPAAEEPPESVPEEEPTQLAPEEQPSEIPAQGDMTPAVGHSGGDSEEQALAGRPLTYDELEKLAADIQEEPPVEPEQGEEEVSEVPAEDEIVDMEGELSPENEGVENIYKMIDEMVEAPLAEKVVKRGDKYCTVHCSGADKGKIIHCFDTKKKAMAQHRAIQMSKNEGINEEIIRGLSKIPFDPEHPKWKEAIASVKRVHDKETKPLIDFYGRKHGWDYRPTQRTINDVLQNHYQNVPLNALPMIYDYLGLTSKKQPLGGRKFRPFVTRKDIAAVSSLVRPQEGVDEALAPTQRRYIRDVVDGIKDNFTEYLADVDASFEVLDMLTNNMSQEAWGEDDLIVAEIRFPDLVIKTSALSEFGHPPRDVFTVTLSNGRYECYYPEADGTFTGASVLEVADKIRDFLAADFMVKSTGRYQVFTDDNVTEASGDVGDVWSFETPEEDVVSTILSDISTSAMAGDADDKTILQKIFQEPWEAIKKKLAQMEDGGSIWQVWWMDGVRALVDDMEGLLGESGSSEPDWVFSISGANTSFSGPEIVGTFTGSYSDAKQKRSEIEKETGKMIYMSSVWDWRAPEMAAVLNKYLGKTERVHPSPLGFRLHSEGGVTRHSLENAKKLIARFGTPSRVELKYVGDGPDWGYFTTVMWPSGQEFTFTGFGWGYHGEGPRGLQDFLKMIGVTDVDVFSIPNTGKLYSQIIEVPAGEKKDKEDTVKYPLGGRAFRPLTSIKDESLDEANLHLHIADVDDAQIQDIVTHAAEVVARKSGDAGNSEMEFEEPGDEEDLEKQTPEIEKSFMHYSPGESVLAKIDGKLVEAQVVDVHGNTIDVETDGVLYSIPITTVEHLEIAESFVEKLFNGVDPMEVIDEVVERDVIQEVMEGN